MRADARRNREQVVAAARKVFVAEGPDAPLEEIARQAGVGIATLYRRFPDRQALMRAVALDALRRIVKELQQAQEAEPDAFQALARYMERVLDLRISAVMPMLASRIALDDEEMFQMRGESTALAQQLIDRAQADGTLRPDVTFGDISLLLIRLGRPLPGSFPATVEDALARRHLTLVLDALRTQRDEPSRPLPGPGLDLAGVRSLSAAGKEESDAEPSPREATKSGCRRTNSPRRRKSSACC